MREPATIKGYMSLIRLIQDIPVSTLKGFDDLTEEQQEALLTMTADVDNNISNLFNNL